MKVYQRLLRYLNQHRKLKVFKSLLEGSSQEEVEVEGGGKIMESYEKKRWNETYRKKGFELGIEEGEFVVALDEEKVYALAPVVYYVWARCDGETTVGAIVQDLLEYVEGSNEDMVYNAVVDIIDKLVEVGLLEKA